MRKSVVIQLLLVSLTAVLLGSCQNSTLDNGSLEYDSLDVVFSASVSGPQWNSDENVAVISSCTRGSVENTPMSSASIAKFKLIPGDSKYSMVHCEDADNVIAKSGDHNYRFYAFAPYSNAVTDLSVIPASVPSTVVYGKTNVGGVYTASSSVSSVISPVNLAFSYSAVEIILNVPANIIDEDSNTVLKSIVFKPSTEENFAGILAGDASYDLYTGTLSKGSGTNMVTIDFEEGLALPKGRMAIPFTVFPFDVPIDGFDVEFTDTDGNQYVANVLADKVGTSYVGGDIVDLAVTAAPTTTGAVSPVEWPLGYADGKPRCSAALQPRWTIEGPLAADKDVNSHIWAGEQENTYIEFVAVDKSADRHLKYEMSNFSQYNYASPCIKGLWTGDYFEINIPVKKFKAGTEVTLTLPMYGRGAPVFWNVEYLDGTEWKCNKTIQKSPDEQFEREVTWVLPHGNRDGSFVGHKMTHTFKVENAIKNGNLRIRITVADGSIISKASSTYNVACTKLSTYVASGSLGSCMVGFVNNTKVKDLDVASVKVEW